jgi:hypothetical protein
MSFASLASFGAKFKDDIEIHLQTLKRSDDRYYEAVSYTWGADEETSRLLVHDAEFATLHLHGHYTLTRMLRYYQVRNQTNSALDVKAECGDDASLPALQMASTLSLD